MAVLSSPRRRLAGGALAPLRPRSVRRTPPPLHPRASKDSTPACPRRSWGPPSPGRCILPFTTGESSGTKSGSRGAQQQQQGSSLAAAGHREHRALGARSSAASSLALRKDSFSAWRDGSRDNGRGDGSATSFSHPLSDSLPRFCREQLPAYLNLASAAEAGVTARAGSCITSAGAVTGGAAVFSGQQSAPHRTAARDPAAQVALLTNPIWVAKTRMQLHAMQAAAAPAAAAGAAAAAAAGSHKATLAGTLGRILREEGVWGLYRGIRPSLLLVSHGAIQFAARALHACLEWLPVVCFANHPA